MKSVSVLILMMFTLGFSQVVISSDIDGSKSPKYKADERTALYFGQKSPKKSASPKSPTGRFIESNKCKGSRDDMSRLQGLSVREALKEVRS